MNQLIREQLLDMAESKYGEFSSSLIPGCDNLIGVRIPALRKFAKKLVRDTSDWRTLLKETDIYFEETMLRGMIIGLGCYKEQDVDKGVKELRQFAPMVDNWSICDCFCASFMLCEDYREEFLPVIIEFLESNEEFKVRIGFILLLNHYLKVLSDGSKVPRKKAVELMDIQDIEFADRKKEKYPSFQYLDFIFQRLAKNHTEGYYAQMAAAWLLAECFVTCPKPTWDFINHKGRDTMDIYTYNKALSKICESKNPSSEIKLKIKALKKYKVEMT